ncbi:hypothetical protein DRP04_04185 [Archaeoglobales archaeon]|nr:MAG: hypothetical protein DRP04_04185 [Archaeoglobales archaeon]
MSNLVDLLKELDKILGIRYLSYREIIIMSFIPVLSILTFLLLTSMKRREIIEGRQHALGSSFLVLILVFIGVFSTLSLEVFSKIAIFGINVEEHTPDTFLILREGHWKYSLKNAYYDFINVPALMRVILSLITDFATPHSVFVASLFSFVVGLVLLIAYYTLMQRVHRAGFITCYLLTILTLVSNPYSSFVNNYMGLSYILALLSLYPLLIYRERFEARMIVLSILLYLGAALTHGVAILMTLCLIVLYPLLKKAVNNPRLHLCLLSFTIVALLIDVLRFIHTGAYRGASTYMHELLNFLFGAYHLRTTRWSSPVVPRITAFSFALLPSLALTPLVTLILIRVMILLEIVHKNEAKGFEQLDVAVKRTLYPVFLLYSLILVLGGFVASFFSNSLSREFGYVGIMLLAIPTSYALSLFRSSRGKCAVLLYLLLILSLILGFATPSAIPWYDGYRDLTLDWRSSFLSFYSHAVNIARFYDAGAGLHLFLYSVDKVPVSYAYLQLHGSILPRGHILVSTIKNSWNFEINKLLDIVYSANHCVAVVK